jgi:hypothetical protein
MMSSRFRTRPPGALRSLRGTRPGLLAVALLAGALLLAPLLCGTHLSFHDQMGPSHGLCIFATTLAVSVALTIAASKSFVSLPVRVLALPAPLLFYPITKPPQ